MRVPHFFLSLWLFMLPLLSVAQQLIPGTIAGSQTVCLRVIPKSLTSVTDASNGDDPVSYQWERNTWGSWSAIPGATGSSYALPYRQGGDGVTEKYRRVAISNEERVASNEVSVYYSLFPTLVPQNIPEYLIVPAEGGNYSFYIDVEFYNDGCFDICFDDGKYAIPLYDYDYEIVSWGIRVTIPPNNRSETKYESIIIEETLSGQRIEVDYEQPPMPSYPITISGDQTVCLGAAPKPIVSLEEVSCSNGSAGYSWKRRHYGSITYIVPGASDASCTPENLQWYENEAIEYYRIADCSGYKEYSNPVNVYYAPPPTITSTIDTIRVSPVGGWYTWTMEMNMDNQYDCTPSLKDFGTVVAENTSDQIEHEVDDTSGQILFPPNPETTSRIFKLFLRDKLQGRNMTSVIVVQGGSPFPAGSIAALRDTVRLGEPTCLQSKESAHQGNPSITYQWEQRQGADWRTIPGATDANYTDICNPPSGTTTGYRRVASYNGMVAISNEVRITYVSYPTIDNWWSDADESTDEEPDAGDTQQIMSPALSGAIDVNAMGAATYTIPIECPVGIQGMQPNVALAYNSQARNGVAGWGWSIAGISAITRTGSTIYHDGKVAGVKMTNEDNLTLDGQRLILVLGSHFTDGAKYRTEVETFSDITYTNSYFKVVTKEGKTMLYGVGDNAVTLQGSSAPLTWLLTRIEDTNGSYMTYTYGKNNANGEFWLDRIAYTGNSIASIAPVNEIVFGYEDRQDVEIYYVAGKKTMQSKRLRTITTKSSGQIFRKYTLEYTYDELYSRLINVKKSTTDGTTYTPLNFTWGKGYSKGKSERSMFFWPLLDKEAIPLFADFNGDGRQDFITINNNTIKFYLNELGEYDAEPKRIFQVKIGSNHVDAFVADLNGDGLVDVVYVAREGNTFRYNFIFFNGETFTYSGLGFNAKAESGDYIVGDFNGDGRQEVLIKSSQKVYDQYANVIAEGGITWGDDWRPELPNNLNLLDFTGSGKTNVCTRNGSNGSIYELDVAARTFRQVLTTSELTNGHDVYPGDYNGDGLMDLYVITNPIGHTVLKNHFLLSTGTGFVRKDMPNLNISRTTKKGFTGDFNLDGKTDFMTAEIYNNEKYYDYSISSYGAPMDCWKYTTYINKSSHFEPQVAVGTNARAHNDDDWKYMNIADYYGDGRSEVNFHRYNRDFLLNSFDDFLCSQISAISNGLNENITLDYLPLASSENAYTSSGNDSGSFPVANAVPLLYVVRSMRNNNDFTEYSYKDILIHRQGKGFLGFGEVNIRSSNGITTTTEYNYEPTYYNVFPVKKTVVGISGYQNTVISTTTYNNDVKTFGGVRIYPYIAVQTTQDHLSNLTSMEGLIVDDYGNPTLVKTVRGSAEETTTATYTSHGSWCPNKPDRITTVQEQKQSAEAHARSTLYEYDANGNLTKEIKDPQDVNRVITEYKDFDVFGRAQSVEVTANDSTLTSTVSYTPSGRFVASRSNAMGETSTYRWDEARGLLLSETGTTGLVTSYKYDAFGRLSETTYPDRTKKFQRIGKATRAPELPYEVRYYAYTKTSDGAKGYAWFDNLGREVCSQAYGLNNEKIFVYTEYNNTGLKTRVSKPMPEQEAKAWQANYNINKEAAEIYTYDDYYRPTKVTTPRGDINYTYNGRTTTITSPEGTRETTLDAEGRIAVSKVNGQAVSYSYYASGLTKSVTPADGQPTIMEYDLQGNRTALADPNAGTITSTYNGFGQLLTQTDARGNTDAFTYDKLGRVEKRETPEASYTYEYGKYGLEKVKRNGSLEYGYYYDELGRMAMESTIVGGSAYTFTYKYNILGQVREKIYPSSFSVAYGYTNGRLKTIGSGSSRLWQLDGENVYGQPLRYSWGSGQQTTLRYDTHELLQAKNSTAQLAGQGYAFNPQTGNLSSRTIGTNTESFTYDALHRLTGWSGNSATYFANGNIKTKTDVGTYAYSSGKPHAVTGIEDLVANPDDMLLGQEQSIAYDSKNRPAYIAQGADSLTFYYDHTGQRLYAKHYKNGTLYKTTHYVGDYEKEVYADSTRTRSFVSAPTGLHAVQEQTAKQGSTRTELLYVHTDHLGSIVALADANGSKLAEYSYDPWGRLRNPLTLQPYSFSAAPTLRLGRGFTGHEHLPEFGLINMNARLYDPLLGRFLNPDPYVVDPEFSQDYNRYSYARNNPLVYTDPNGEIVWFVPLIYFGVWATIEYGSQVYQNYQINKQLEAQGLDKMSTKDMWLGRIDWLDVGISGLSGALTSVVPAAAPYIMYATPAVTNAVNWYGDGQFQTVFDGSISLKEYAYKTLIDVASTYATNVVKTSLVTPTKGVEVFNPQNHTKYLTAEMLGKQITGRAVEDMIQQSAASWLGSKSKAPLYLEFNTDKLYRNDIPLYPDYHELNHVVIYPNNPEYYKKQSDGKTGSDLRLNLSLVR